MDVEGCSLPEDRLYDWEEKIWTAREGSVEIWTVGMIGAFASFIGPVNGVTYRADGGTVLRGRSLAMVESVRFTGAVRSPFDGDWVERNLALKETPRRINEDPFGSGWVARLRPARPEEARPWLESAAQIFERAKEWIRTAHVRCWPVIPDLEMFEIGLECSAILTQVNEELAKRPAGWAIRLVTDDPTSPIELERWSDQTGHAILARRREGTLYEFLLRKEENPIPRIPRRD